jgi:hypothetical protein
VHKLISFTYSSGILKMGKMEERTKITKDADKSKRAAKANQGDIDFSLGFHGEAQILSQGRKQKNLDRRI